jgi:hypothetical protein
MPLRALLTCLWLPQQILLHLLSMPAGSSSSSSVQALMTPSLEAWQPRIQNISPFLLYEFLEQGLECTFHSVRPVYGPHCFQSQPVSSFNDGGNGFLVHKHPKKAKPT